MTTRGSGEVSDRILTVPNMLSFLRLALVPVFLILLVEGEDLWALATLAVSGFTDFLDGYLARRLNQISRLGQLLDPAADRLYILAALLGLAWRDLVPWWLVIVILGRDVMLVVIGLFLANRSQGPFPVSWVGKWATACLFVGLPLVMLGAAFPEISPIVHPIGWAVTIVGAVLYWWAGVIYLVQAMKIARSRRHGSHPSDTLD